MANQRANGGQWNYLGTFALAPGQDHRIEVADGPVDGEVVADAIAIDIGSHQATWEPTVPVRDDYELFGRWFHFSGNASNAPFTVHHEGGSTLVPMSQQVNGGQWVSLGTYRLGPGQNHRVELTDDADGEVVADAIQMIPAAIPNLATWNLPITSSGSYDVYARWTSSVNRATNATYTVHHASGSTPVSVDQQVNGGQWNLLGTFTLTPGQNHSVELSDISNGTVVADALYVVPHNPTPNQVTWTPTLSGTEILDIYAKWTADADRSDEVTYIVHHAGGSTPIVVNQRQNGGTWNYLGQFSMVPASNHRVEVADNKEGVVVADAIRFVSAGTGGGSGLFYVHADHLGTPQKMTDGSKVVVWDAVYKPFGEAHSITGSASNNQRFPGQFFDSEVGFHQNYFRDYDPTIGRYVESDPIGLDGGLNTFLYVYSNPLYWIDPLGLEEEHTKGARESTREKHEAGEARKNQDKGGEKGDKNRRPPRRPPGNHKGPWPPKKFFGPLFLNPCIFYPWGCRLPDPQPANFVPEEPSGNSCSPEPEPLLSNPENPYT